MNKVRRKELGKIKDCLTALYSDIERVKNDEEDCFDNMPDGIQCSMRGEESEEAIEILDEVCEDMEKIIEMIEEIIS